MEIDQTNKDGSEQPGWIFEVGDIVTADGSDKFEIMMRLINADSGERYYRLSHTSINASAFDLADGVEERHHLADNHTPDN